MLNLLRRTARGFVPQTVDADWRASDDAIWIDLVNPTAEEERAVEEAYGLDLPTREETKHLEPSSRLYQESGATFLTATLLARADEPHPVATPVTLVLANDVLITIRYEPLKAFTIFAERCAHAPVADGGEAALELLDAIVERSAEVLEQQSNLVHETSVAIFNRPPSTAFGPLLSDLARAQSITSTARKSLVSLSRLSSFAALAQEFQKDEGRRGHLTSIQHDIQALTEQSSFTSGHISFLLDAALGLINIEQNSIIKFFSVVAVVFLPPTLVASIYGMNFDLMPELKWAMGYPWALVLMVISGVAPFIWFKKKGWL
ncbi:CorA family divalent cation transporter [Phenylobacterium sp. Root700]|uniref:CorA family divalent cation transporter n=1 Tax=Phenylobacterium sp. Root700 TaxID=1736591 RepID=UPI0006FCE4AD|nr:CorA family divalent cation transporter [Phenylobacterium sp. Root700]KRB40676.1 magnesium transporter [Phenylobacterium sp. Root700]